MTVWTEANDRKLRAHWDTGLSTRLIGEAMNMSKNAVVGRAHRLNLQERPSPIIRRRPKPPQPPKALPAGAVTLPPLPEPVPPALAPARPYAGPQSWHAPSALGAALDFPTPERVARIPRAELVPAAPSPHKRCQWLCGPDTGCYGRHLPFCEAVTVHGSSYCREHYKAAHNANAWQGEALRVSTMGAA